MNKEQEALDKIRKHCLASPSYEMGEEFGFGSDYDLHHDGYEDEVDTLQELIDSKKPVKPTMLPYKGFDGEVASYQGCPNCTIPITNVFTSREYKPKFCQECGREFDWSKDERNT